MIIEVKTHIHIPQILRLANFIEDTPVDKLREMLLQALNSNESKILIEKIDDKIRAFVLASIEEFDGEEAVFIQSCFIDPHARGVGYEMFNKLNAWAKDNGLNAMYAMTTRSPAPFLRKYKFQFKYSVLKRRL
jgi:N-acetylglutamate synthase-like GNAT family acetyltransferase